MLRGNPAWNDSAGAIQAAGAAGPPRARFREDGACAQLCGQEAGAFQAGAGPSSPPAGLRQQQERARLQASMAQDVAGLWAARASPAAAGASTASAAMSA
jgi:hypothetical protein